VAEYPAQSLSVVHGAGVPAQKLAEISNTYFLYLRTVPREFTVLYTHSITYELCFHMVYICTVTINVPVVYMGQYEVVLRGEYP
jgi:hypothetical protein